MKSERRHELKTNTLAQGLGGLPVFWQQYGTKVLLGVVAVLAIILFIRMQRITAQQQREAAGEAYSAAVTGLASLQNLPMMVRDPRAAADQARQLQTQVETAISQVLDTTEDDALKAEALVARGDLNWHMARLPGIRPPAPTPTTASTTSPSTTRASLFAPPTSANETDELLEKAKRAYDAAVRANGAKPVTVASARFGLAAIAEQRRQWEDARKQYEDVRSDPATPGPFKTEAGLRLDDLKKMQQPVLIGRPATLPVVDLPDVEGPSATAPIGPPVPSTGATVPATTTRATTGPGAKP